MDAPKHFISGAGGMETLPLDTLIGPARVIEIENPDRVEAEELRGKNIGGATRLLIKTRNSAARWWEKSFDPDFCHMTEEAARVLLDAGMKLLGVDCLSVDGYAAGAAPVHNLLLPAGVVLLEGLNLSDAPPGRLRAFRAARPFRGPGRGPGKSGVEDYLAFRREFSIGLSTQ
jgi:arylformamidase